MALILAAIVAIGSVLLALLILFAGGMSDNISQSRGAGGSAVSTLIIGLIVAALLAGSHWIHWAW